MIRQQAFGTDLPMLIGGLHCHTTRSDGSATPEEVIAIHEQNGYDFLAITDHRFYNYRNYNEDSDLLIIPGMEMDRGISSDLGMCFHAVVIGPEKENGNGYDQDQRFDSGSVATAEEFQEQVLDPAYANGNLSFYCHPEWSCTSYDSYVGMEGLIGMEIWNSGCVMVDGQDTNALGWDDCLRKGKRWYGLATDDGHSINQHCHGWVVVAADKTVSSVLDGLKKGRFYSSCGPEIYDFYVTETEDGNLRAFIRCSEVSKVRLITGTRPAQLHQAMDTTADSFVFRKDVPYVRMEITDADGRLAWTNPIFL